MEELFNNIIENTPQSHFWTIFFSGYIWCTILCIISCIDRAVSMRMWETKDYEKIIHKHLHTCDASDEEERLIIARAKSNAEKRYQIHIRRIKRKQRINKIFKKFKK